MGLRVSCVPDVCGVFGGRVLGEDFAAGVGDGFVLRAPAFRSRVLNLAKTYSIGLRSGEDFGKKTRRAPTLRIARRTTLSLVGAEIVEDHDVAWLERRHEELFDIGVEALAVDGPVEQAGRIDAVVAQGGEERRGLPLALRDLVDEPLSPWRPAAQAGHIGLGPEPAPAKAGVSSMKTSRLGSMSP